MSFFQPQNPGIGGIDELTPAEESFLTTFAGLSFNEGDYLTISGGQPAWSAINLSGYIPYTGATTDVDLGLHNLTVDTNTLFVDSINHRVGIRTTSPTSTLHVVGTGYYSSTLTVDGASVKILGGANAPNGSGSNGTLIFGNITYAMGYASTYAWLQSYSGNPYIMNPLGNNVGVGGTALPTYKFDVYGTGTTGGINTNIGLNLKQVSEASNTATYTIAAGGSVDTGLHYYNIVFYTAIGDTAVSNRISVTTTGGNNTVNITNIPVSSDPSVVGRKIYRSKLGEGSSYGWLVTTIADNTTTSYSDTASDASLTNNSGNYNKPNTTNEFITINDAKAMVLDTYQTIFGKGAGAAITTGALNVLIGAGAGSSLTTGEANIVLGGSTLSASSTQNIIAGYSTFGGSGNYNIALGFFNQQAAGNREHNITLGYATGTAITTSDGNIIIGNYAGASLTTGGRNVVLGKFAMNARSSSSQENTACGYFSLGGASGIASENSALGAYAGYGITTGTGNTFAGWAAGGGVTTGSTNTMIGYQAGNAITTTGGGVYLGYKAGYYETGANKFFVDNQSRTNEATSRTSSLMYGVFNATVANQTLDINATLTVNNNVVSSNYFIASVGNALTAVGTDRATALQLAKQINNVTTAAAGTGVILPVGALGMRITVFNNGANPIQVYASASETIDTVAGATGVPLTNALRCEYFYVAANTWISAQLGVVSA